MNRLFAALCCTLFITQLTRSVEGKLRKNFAPNRCQDRIRIFFAFIAASLELQIIVTKRIISRRMFLSSKNKSLDRLFACREPVPSRVFMYFQRKFNCPNSAVHPSMFQERPESGRLYHPFCEIPAAESGARKLRARLETAASRTLRT